ncbi:ROK family protein [Limibacter armeniacum]|uniref:ROK family protein n=1 Tax=Limibacter armeniacum TaxID=466084 RepID=UPI002FE5A5DF
MYTIGLDLGGTKIKIGLIHNGQIVEEIEVDAASHLGLQNRLPVLEKEINQLLEKHGANDFQGIGISIPGIVDVNRARLLTINDKYNDAVDIDLKAWAKSVWNKPLFMENDARSAMVGEWKYGAGKGHDNVVMMTLGTGLGTSAVIEGKVVRGQNFQAGILGGHFIVNYKGQQCNCGNVGCAEAEASSWNLPNIIAALEEKSGKLPEADKVDFAQLFTWYREGNAAAKYVVDHCIKIWSTTVANLVYAYDPEVVIIGGGIMRSADIILPAIKENLKSFGWVPFDKIELKTAEFVHASALLSAEYFLSELNN